MRSPRPVLEPGLPVLWRDRTTVQLGLHPDRAVVLGGVRAADAATLRSLDGAHDLPLLYREAADRGGDAAGVDHLLRLLTDAALLRPAPADDPISSAWVAVHGAGRLGCAVAGLLVACGVGSVTVEDSGVVRAEDVGVGAATVGDIGRRRDAAALARLRELAGRPPGAATPDRARGLTGPPLGAATPDRARGLAGRPPGAATPDRAPGLAGPTPGATTPGATTPAGRPPTGPAETAQAPGARGCRSAAEPNEPPETAEPVQPHLTVLAPAERFGRRDAQRAGQDGAAHLVVLVTADVATVGPLVVPGRSSCLRCHDLHRTDRDPQWPQVVGQLEAGRHGVADPLVVMAAAVLATAEAIGWLRTGRAGSLDGTLVLDAAGGPAERRRWTTHPACGCTWDGRGDQDGRH